MAQDLHLLRERAGLSDREDEVMTLLLRGLDSGEIAKVLDRLRSSKPRSPRVVVTTGVIGPQKPPYSTQPPSREPLGPFRGANPYGSGNAQSMDESPLTHSLWAR